MMNINYPKISVILPVYNGEMYINDAIQSIINQTEKNFELIIINDGSTDKTENIILSFSDTRIVYIKNEINLRLIKSLNKGIDNARGKYIARMDADDISFPKRFERQLEIFNSFQGVSMVNLKTLLIDNEGKHSYENRSTVQVGIEAIKYIQPLKNMISHPGIMVKADILKKYKYKDEMAYEHIEDYELWTRMLEDGHICYTIEEPLLYYRVSTGSINRTQSKIQHQRMFNFCKPLLNKNYNYYFSDDVLNNIIGENQEYSYVLLKRTYDELKNYIQNIKDNRIISLDCWNDLRYWVYYRTFSISGRFIKKGTFRNRIGVYIFLLTHLNWVNVKKFRIKLKNILSSQQKVTFNNLKKPL